MDSNTQDDNDGNGKGSFDSNKKGVKFNRPVAQPGDAPNNMKSLAPGGGLWDGKSKSGQTNSTESSDGDMKESVTLDVSDFVEAIFEGQNLSDEFKNKAAVIFESALNQKVQIIEQAILEASQEVIAEQVAENVAIITEKVDEYLGVVVGEWLTENKLAVEQGFRTEIAENFIAGLKDLFENSYVEVPEEKVDLVDELFAENRKLEDNVNELLKERMELQQSNLVNECATVFIEMSGDLADTEVEKLASLSEGIEFNDVNTYRNKLSVLKESYFTKNSASSQVLTEDTSPIQNQTAKNVMDNEMAAYVNNISKHLKLTNRKV
jgi:hypothetical protein